MNHRDYGVVTGVVLDQLQLAAQVLDLGHCRIRMALHLTHQVIGNASTPPLPDASSGGLEGTMHDLVRAELLVARKGRELALPCASILARWTAHRKFLDCTDGASWTHGDESFCRWDLNAGRQDIRDAPGWRARGRLRVSSSAWPGTLDTLQEKVPRRDRRRDMPSSDGHPVQLSQQPLRGTDGKRCATPDRKPTPGMGGIHAFIARDSLPEVMRVRAKEPGRGRGQGGKSTIRRWADSMAFVLTGDSRTW